jgi:uncharacterized repeat protein (TIGR03803 family)
MAGLVLATNPLSGLVQSGDGNLYGCTYLGGATGAGTIFAITTQGALKTLHNFASTDGDGPFATLLDADGGF